MTAALWALVFAVWALVAVLAILALIHGEVIRPRDDAQIREDIGPVASGVNVTTLRAVADDEAPA